MYSSPSTRFEGLIAARQVPNQNHGSAVLLIEKIGPRVCWGSSLLRGLFAGVRVHAGLDVLSTRPRGLTPKLRGTRGTRLTLLLPSISHLIYSMATDWAPLRPRCDAGSRSAIITARSIHVEMPTAKVHQPTCLDSSNYVVNQLFVLVICVQVGTSHGWCCRKSAVATSSESVPIISRVHYASNYYTHRLNFTATNFSVYPHSELFHILFHLILFCLTSSPFGCVTSLLTPWWSEA